MILYSHGGDHVIAKMSHKVSSFIIDHGIISETDRDVYEYSFEILFSTFSSTVALVILSIASATELNTLLFLLGFVPLRLVAGGYHAKTHFICLLILMFTYAIFLIIVSFIPANYIIPATITSFLLAGVLVFLLAPSDSTNKPLSSKETIRFKTKSRIAIACYSIVVGLTTLFISDKHNALSLVLGTLSVGISLIANYISCKQKNWKK
jgi:accessory gene regulator B